MKRSRWLPITWMAVLTALMLIGGMASSAWAAIIFMDDFERAVSNTVGNGWAEIENDSNDVALKSITDSVTSITSTRLQLTDRNPDAAAIQENISTFGYTDITLMYDWAAQPSSESSDELFVDWKLPSEDDWEQLAMHTLGDNGPAFSSNTVSLGSDAADQSAIQFRFWTDVNRGNEGAYIDNVKLTGTGTGPTAAIPEPGTLLLIGSGLVGLGVGTRRRSGRR